jgi:hypothetical protein
MIDRSCLGRVFKTGRQALFCGTFIRTTYTEFIAHTETVYDRLSNSSEAGLFSFAEISTAYYREVYVEVED